MRNYNITTNPGNHDQPFNLTDIQYAYWIGRQNVYSGGNLSCHLYFETDFRDLDVRRLEKAANLMVRRHGMLRGVIGQDALQRVRKNAPYYEVDYKDLSRVDEARLGKLLEQEREALSHSVHDAAKGDVFFLGVRRLPDRYRMYASLDMLFMDGTSVGIFLDELGRFYLNPDLRLPEPPFEFGDYVRAVEEIKKGGRYDNDKKYWLDKMDTLPYAPELPMAQFDPEAKPRFSRVCRKFSSEIWSKIREKAEDAGGGAVSVLLLLFGKVLEKWSKNPRFLMNTTLFERLPVHDRVDRIIGDFTTLEMFAFDGTGFAEKPFSQQVIRVHDLLAEDVSHNLFTGVEVSRALAGTRGRSEVTAPVVFTSLLHTDAGFADNPMAGQAGYIDTPFRLFLTPQVWIDNMVLEEAGQLVVEWNYDTRLFPENMMADMHDAYCSLIESAAQQDWAEADLSECLRTRSNGAVERANETNGEVSDEHLHTLFIKQAEKNPESVAVISPGTTLSYGDLHELSARIGNGLKKAGARPNTLVAVIMDKGWEQIPAVLGILYAGAAYLPINSTDPEGRINTLLEIGEVDLVLAQPGVLSQISLPDHIIGFEITKNCFAHEAAEMGTPVQSLEDIAYVIFTSGSTGTPKGVVIDHRGAVNTILDINRRFGVTSEDRVFGLTPLNFDLSVYDIFGLLAAGGAMVLPAADERTYPSHWAELMRENRVTLWNTVPALMQLLVEYQAGCPLDTPLRLVMMSGDWIPLDLPERIRKLWPDAALISLGGATEASIWSIFYPIETVAPEWAGIPYGKPLANQTFHVLDRNMVPRPVWVPDQLYIGGIGLALGYWRDREKTDAAFVIHPRTGERLYKTGDLGRYLPDGNIEFLGREDFQVKIRGNRIELGEIECCLLKHPEVKETVVLGVGDDRDDKQLAAYIVPTEAGGARDQDACSLEAMRGVITDPAERIKFKMDQRGIRRFDADRPRIELSRADVDDAAFLSRQSYRQFSAGPIAASQLGRLLGCLSPRSFSCGVLPKYRYPSAGSLYPVQTCLYVKPDRITGLQGGLYAYNPPGHELVLLPSTAIMDRAGHIGDNRTIFDRSAFSIFLVADYKAIEPMYGDMSRDFCLLEAGYMSQLLMMEAPNADLGLCPVGGMDFEPLRAEFGLTDSQEMIHSFMGGGISAEQKQQLIQTMDHDEFQGESEPVKERLPERLKDWLRQKLPGYMVPNLFVQLPALPLTPNGKIDRKALPRPELRRQSARIVMPENDLERGLVRLVHKHFNVESISLTDNFFDLGANSLDMVQLYNEIKAEFQHEITVADVFRHATVKQLAELLSQAPAATISSSQSEGTDVPATIRDPEQIDRLSANLDNLTEAEVDRLLDELEDKGVVRK